MFHLSQNRFLYSFIELVGKLLIPVRMISLLTEHQVLFLIQYPIQINNNTVKLHRNQNHEQRNKL